MSLEVYVVLPLLTAGEMREILGYAGWHVSEASGPTADAERLLDRVEAMLATCDAADADRIFVACGVAK